MSSFSSDYGVQEITDAALLVGGTGLPVYYRIQNTVPPANQEAIALGFEVPAVSGQIGGTTDLQIYPQPRVKSLSMHLISQSMGKLNERSKLFVISHSFVVWLMTQYAGITEEEMAFDSTWAGFMGLVYEGKLYNVQQWAHREVGGVTVSWRLTCNAAV